MAKDQISTKAIVFLLVVTIIVTIAGTWLILGALTSAGSNTRTPYKEQASISLVLIEPPNEDNTSINEEGG